MALAPQAARAAFFHGETLDTVANVASWIVLVVGPIVLISLFWLVHILPEKIAEKKHHPQTKAIQALCLLSLVFGGMLWPLALLWATATPVLHKIAYGTDKVPHDKGETPPQSPDSQAPTRQELKGLRARIERFEQGAPPPTPEEVQEMQRQLAALEAAVNVPMADKRG
jgi:hypothetical protein